MELGDILGPNNILPELQATNRWDAIDELIGNLVRTEKIKPEHREAVTAAVKKRENSMSTGIGFGIGLPHASTDLIHEVVGALGRSKTGVNFDALDNQPVNLVMLFLVLVIRFSLFIIIMLIFFLFIMFFFVFLFIVVITIASE